MLELLGYYRSSASYRVRIALNYKNLSYQQSPVHLLKDGGQQYQKDYTDLNPQALVPCLIDDDKVLTQSLAIIEYLEECYPEPSLLPAENSLQRAKMRAIALSLACDVHPLNNLRVLKYLQNNLNINDAQKDAWYQYWVLQGFNALETQLQRDAASQGYCVGNKVSIADVCLIPQVFNALRFNVDMQDFPRITTVYNNCMQLDAFKQAAPEQQPDAQ